MEFTLYAAECKGKKENTKYPNKYIIENEEDFCEAISYDHVCSEFKNSYRSAANFISADCLVMDNDNEHSDDPKDWIYPEDYEKMFPHTSYVVAPSRNNMRVKGNISARPRHHVYFPHDVIINQNDYKELKKSILEQYPFFDKNAVDAARFIFGNAAEEIIWHDGELTIDCVLTAPKAGIPQGQRNSTMSRFAGRVVKRYGATDRAYSIFLEESKKCNPPLDDEELSVIWRSACKFAKKVQSQDGYIPPEDYEFGNESLKPYDYSDIGQAKVLAREYGDELMYTAATDLLRYNGVFWEESKQKAVGAAIEFLDLQLEDAKDEVKNTLDTLVASGVAEADAVSGGKRFISSLDPEKLKLYEKYAGAKAYMAFVMKRRDMKYIASALQTLKPLVNADVAELDSDPYLLNTPTHTYDLRKGIAGKQEHNPKDKITKVTSYDPDDKGKDIWLAALDEFYCGNSELIDYVQQMFGQAIIGKVLIEALIIAYGEGGNGKSTFGNAILRVLGSYGGTISADALTVGCKRNVKPELAEAKGKRLLIAAELEEGMRLNTSMVKQLCSIDAIEAEKKYKDPFHFTPTHALLLYTNHLPRVGAMDDGIWRRLIIIPFNAKINPKIDIKNYADFLAENAGGYILKWLIEGAEKVIKNNYKPKIPKCVLDAIGKYRQDNDWMTHFLDDCCELGVGLREKSGEVYQAYRAYCARTGEFARSTTEFYNALEVRGIERKRTKKERLLLGLRLTEANL